VKQDRILPALLLSLSLLSLSAAGSSANDSEEGSFSFRYGIVAKLHTLPESLVKVDEFTELGPGDSIRIHFWIPGGSSFFVFLKSGKDDIRTPFSSTANRAVPESEGSAGSSGWIPVGSEGTKETLYLIGSRQPPAKLISLCLKHDQASGKLRRKYARKISAELEEYAPEDREELAELPTSLRSPRIVGAVFRGAGDAENESFLFNTCSGAGQAGCVLNLRQP